MAARWPVSGRYQHDPILILVRLRTISALANSNNVTAHETRHGLSKIYLNIKCFQAVPKVRPPELVYVKCK